MFLTRSTLVVGGLLAARNVCADAAPRTLGFLSTHTGERLRTTYWADGRYEPEALQEINRVLRDHRTGDVRDMDVNLLDLLHQLESHLRVGEPFHVISGYRSPATNAFLAAESNGVAKHSLHLEGRAIDIRLPAVPLAQLRRAALSLQQGGVGYYPSLGFVHVDTGRIRTW